MKNRWLTCHMVYKDLKSSSSQLVIIVYGYKLFWMPELAWTLGTLDKEKHKMDIWFKYPNIRRNLNETWSQLGIRSL